MNTGKMADTFDNILKSGSWGGLQALKLKILK